MTYAYLYSCMHVLTCCISCSCIYKGQELREGKNHVWLHWHNGYRQQDDTRYAQAYTWVSSSTTSRASKDFASRFHHSHDRSSCTALHSKFPRMCTHMHGVHDDHIYVCDDSSRHTLYLGTGHLDTIIYMDAERPLRGWKDWHLTCAHVVSTFIHIVYVGFLWILDFMYRYRRVVGHYNDVGSSFWLDRDYRISSSWIGKCFHVIHNQTLDCSFSHTFSLIVPLN